MNDTRGWTEDITIQHYKFTKLYYIPCHLAKFIK